jgi:uncharacterized protein
MNQKPAISYFIPVFVISILASIAVYVYKGFMGVYQANILSILELSLSFDNAVVNAIILANMAVFWRKAFITWGMIVAVFGMRLLFPVLIVVFTTDMGFIDAMQLSLNEPAKYEAIIQSSHHILMSFGGTFLLMVFLTFLFDKNKETHWIPFVEKIASRWAASGEVKIVIIMLLMTMIGYFAPNEVMAGAAVIKDAKSEIVLGMVYGVTLFVVIDLVKNALEERDEEKGNEGAEHTELENIDANAKAKAVQGGIASFIYLELIDASFSFDGVLGAFAVTQNIVVMAIGLGVGAFAVRSLTLLLVDRGTISEYRYLEHGAMWSIGMLALSMIVQIFSHLPEALITTVAIAPITIAFLHSWRLNKLEASR